MVLALRGGQLDLVVQMSPQQARAFKNTASTTCTPFRSRRTTCSVCGSIANPFRDARVRRAVALTLNRPDIINRVLLGAGTIGDDSPFFPGFPSTDPSIQQRKQNLDLAKALLQAAGQENLKFTITTHNQFDVPDFAAAVQASGRQAGIDIDLDIMTLRRLLLSRRRRGLQQHDALAQRTRDHHRVRSSRCSEPLPHRPPTCRTASGTRRSTRTTRSTRRLGRTSRRPMSRRSARRRRRWRASSSATRR